MAKGKPGRPKKYRGITPTQFKSIIDAHIKAMSQRAQKWDRWREVYQGNWGAPVKDLPQGAGEPGRATTTLETNYYYAFADTMVANICPLNPQVTVNPRHEDNRDKAKAREVLANQRLHRLQTYKKLWAQATHASMYGLGFLKLTWNTKMSQPRLVVRDPRHIFFDENADSWEDIRYIIEAIPVTRQVYEERCAKGQYKQDLEPKFGKYPAWLRDTGTNDNNSPEDVSRDVFEWTIVYECYDFTIESGQFLHMLEGNEQPLAQEGELPYPHWPNPFTMLVFNDNLQDLTGLSDAQLIEGAQNTLNELDVLEVEFVKTSMPVAFFNTTIIQNATEVEEAYASASGAGAFISCAIQSGLPISAAISWSPTPSLVPEHHRTRQRCMEIMAFVLGMPAFQRGSYGGAEIATEVALANSANQTREGRRRKLVFEKVEWIAEGTIALYAQFLSKAEQLYIKGKQDEPGVIVTPATAGFSDSRPFEYDYEMVAYSPTETNRLVQLQQVQALWPVLQWAVEQQTIDGIKLVRRVLELLQIDGVEGSGQQMPAQMPPLAQAGQNPDNPAAGGMPPGVADISSAGAYPMGGPGNGRATPGVVRGTEAFPKEG